MLGDYTANPTIAVKDLEAARKFYEVLLELPVEYESEYVIGYRTQNGELQVYVSDFAGTNQATAVTWVVPDLDDLVGKLVRKGVVFEHYDTGAGMERSGEIHTMGGQRAAWFKDPAGNVHALISAS